MLRTKKALVNSPSFYSNENAEPAHIHVQRDRMLAKFWLKPVALASSTRFSPKYLRKLELLVVENKDNIIEGLE